MTLFFVADVELRSVGRIVLGGVNPALGLESPRDFEMLIGRLVEIRTRQGSAFRRTVLGARAVVSLSGAYNLFLLIEAHDQVVELEGAEVVLLPAVPS